MSSFRYIRITPQYKGYTKDLEVSGFRLYNGDDLVDLSQANVSLNFLPSQGDGSFFTRMTIVENEALVIPANCTTGNNSIYIDLGSSVTWDAFQIGFGSTDESSLTKFSIYGSTDQVNYYLYEDISKELKLVFTNSYTFSSLSAANTGYPGFINKRLGYSNINNGGKIYAIADNTERRIKTKGNVNTSSNFSYGIVNVNTSINFTQSYFIFSSLLKRDKYYFEFSLPTKYANNSVNGERYLIISFANNATGPRLSANLSNSLAVGLDYGYCGTWASPTSNTLTIESTITAAKYGIPGAVGYHGGLAIDLINGIFQVVNSPYTANFTYNNTNLINGFNNLAAFDRVFFGLSGASNQDFSFYDISFNFGQQPFVKPPPDGYNSIIGQRWLMELDPNFKDTILLSPSDKSLHATDLPYYTGLFKIEVPVGNKSENFCYGFEHTYYIKGHVTQTDGQFRKKKISLLTYPELFELRSTTSSEIDGLYEFLYLEDRQYCIVSLDSVYGKYTPEILGIVNPDKMEDL